MQDLWQGGYLVHKGTRDNPDIDVYKCASCGTKFLSEIRDNDYENGFMNQTDHLSDAEIRKRLSVCQRDDLRRYQRMKDICRGKTVLDFGCGFGGFLKYISEVAPDCSGVELGRDERGYLQRQGIRCTRTIEEQNKKFDVITLFHCFEHLSSPEAWLKTFAGYLEADGKLFIEVPNANDALLEQYGSRAFEDFTYWSAHLYLYTIESLKLLIERTGLYDILSVEQIQRYPISNHLMWLAKGAPGGHEKWSHLDTEELDRAYEQKLRELKGCDTLFFVLSPKGSGADDLGRG